MRIGHFHDMVLAKRLSPSGTRTTFLSFLFACVIAINIVWNNISYQYISTRLVEISKFKISSSYYHAVTTRNSSPTFLKLIQKSRLVSQFEIQKIVDKSKHWNDHPKMLRIRRNDVVKSYNESKLEEQKVCQNGTHSECKTFKEQLVFEMNEIIVEHFLIRENETKDSFVNLHRFGYHFNSYACTQQHVVPILVHSKFDNFEKRNQIRNTWGSYRSIKGITFTTIFLLGEPSIGDIESDIGRIKRGKKQERQWQQQMGRKLETMWKSVYTEASTFGDMVMGNFTDSYRNLTIKHIMALHWALSHCPQALYIVKVDDDVVVNVFILARYLTGDNRSHSELLTCQVPTMITPMRSKTAKWFLTEVEYPFPEFPVWCYGFGELMTRDVAMVLLEMSRDVRNFWIDDVYVTGFLRHKAGLSVTDMYSITGKNSTFFVFPDHRRNETFLRIWKDIIKIEHELA